MTENPTPQEETKKDQEKEDQGPKIGDLSPEKDPSGGTRYPKPPKD